MPETRHRSKVFVNGKENMNVLRKCFCGYLTFDFCASLLSQRAAGLKTLITIVLMVPPVLR